MAESMTYPRRPSYFAHRYCRLLTKTCAAQDVGHIAFVLCVTIAHLEDAKRYKGAVTFFNEQLMPLIGVTKWETLARARRRAVEAGWLHYEPGEQGKRRPGRYWVTVPAGLDDLDDTPCDETRSPAKGERPEEPYPAKGEREGDREGDREGEPSTLTLNPSPKEKEPAGAGGPPGALLELIDAWNGLGDQIVLKGNGARRDPPSKAALKGWARAMKEPDQRETFKDIPAVLGAIRKARLCHKEGYFTVPWLFGKNKNREFIICRLMAGAYERDFRNSSSRTIPAGPGQRHLDDVRNEAGRF